MRVAKFDWILVDLMYSFSSIQLAHLTFEFLLIINFSGLKFL